MHNTFRICCICVQWLGIAGAFELVSAHHALAAPSGAQQSLPPGTFEPRVLDTESYAETFTAIADLDDGTYVQIQLVITNIGPGSKHGGCRLLLVPPKGKPETQHKDVDQKGWSYTIQPSPQLRVGACRMASTATGTQIDGYVGPTSIRLTMNASAQRVTPPHYPIRVGTSASDGIYESEILVPWSNVRAVIRRGEDQQERQLTGVGYMDHSRSTAAPAQLARGWVRFRGLRSPCAMLLLARLPPQGTDPWEGYAWFQGSSTPVALSDLRGDFPKKAATVGGPFSLQSEALQIAIRPDHGLYRYAPLEEYGLLGRMIKSWVGSSITRTYRASMNSNFLQSPLPSLTAVASERFTRECARIQGILEITHVER